MLQYSYQRSSASRSKDAFLDEKRPPTLRKPALVLV